MSEVVEFDLVKIYIQSLNISNEVWVKTLFYIFSYYAIALAEAMGFDQAIEVCTLALAYGAKDGLGIGFERCIEQIAQQKGHILSSNTA
jgi:hypothetical protein